MTEKWEIRLFLILAVIGTLLGLALQGHAQTICTNLGETLVCDSGPDRGTTLQRDYGEPDGLGVWMDEAGRLEPYRVPERDSILNDPARSPYGWPDPEAARRSAGSPPLGLPPPAQAPFLDLGQ